jgi:hypothetical protein
MATKRTRAARAPEVQAPSSDAPEGAETAKAPGAPATDAPHKLSIAEIVANWPIEHARVPVRCTLPGYEWLEVVYRVGNHSGVVASFQRLGDSPTNGQYYGLFPLFVRGFKVTPEPGQAEPPTAREIFERLDCDNWRTFSAIDLAEPSLLIWIRVSGYSQAIQSYNPTKQ